MTDNIKPKDELCGDPEYIHEEWYNGEDGPFCVRTRYIRADLHDAAIAAKDAEIARLDDVITDCWAAVILGVSPERALLRVHAIIRKHFQSKDADKP